MREYGEAARKWTGQEGGRRGRREGGVGVASDGVAVTLLLAAHKAGGSFGEK